MGIRGAYVQTMLATLSSPAGFDGQRATPPAFDRRSAQCQIAFRHTNLAGWQVDCLYSQRNGLEAGCFRHAHLDSEHCDRENIPTDARRKILRKSAMGA